jgi:hypothetical protein
VERIAPDRPATVAWAQLDAIRPLARRLDPATLEALVERAQARRTDLDAGRVARALGLRATGDLPARELDGRIGWQRLRQEGAVALELLNPSTGASGRHGVVQLR